MNAGGKFGYSRKRRRYVENVEKVCRTAIDHGYYLIAAPCLPHHLPTFWSGSRRVQIKLFHKLLGAFIVASLASIVLFASIAHWTMGRSFLQYINDAREQRLETFASSLSQWYLNEGG